MISFQEFARSLPGSRSRHTESEESLVDDPMENDDIEEVVEPADPNLEPKEILLAKTCFHFGLFQQTEEQCYRIFGWVEPVVAVVTRGPLPFIARRIPLTCR